MRDSQTTLHDAPSPRYPWISYGHVEQPQLWYPRAQRSETEQKSGGSWQEGVNAVRYANLVCVLLADGARVLRDQGALGD